MIESCFILHFICLDSLLVALQQWTSCEPALNATGLTIFTPINSTTYFTAQPAQASASSTNSLCDDGFRLQVMMISSSCANTSGAISEPCGGNGECSWRGVLGESFSCSCDGGYMGAYCQEFDPCLLNPCLSGGTCVTVSSPSSPSSNSSYRCECAPGYAGKCDLYTTCSTLYST